MLPANASPMNPMIICMVHITVINVAVSLLLESAPNACNIPAATTGSGRYDKTHNVIPNLVLVLVLDTFAMGSYHGKVTLLPGLASEFHLARMLLSALSLALSTERCV